MCGSCEQLNGAAIWVMQRKSNGFSFAEYLAEILIDGKKCYIDLGFWTFFVFKVILIVGHEDNWT